MRAFTITGKGACHFATLHREVELGPDDVMIEMDTVGFCGTDLSTFRGRNPLVSYPRIPGHEVAARLVKSGPDVSQPIEEGAAVTVYPYTNCGTCASCRGGRPNACKYNETLGVQRDGAMRERLVVKAWTVIATEDLSPRQAALIEPVAVGMHAVRRGSIGGDDVVLVLGCGQIGLSAVAAAAAAGAYVIATDLDERKLAIAERCGAQHADLPQATGLRSKLRDASGGRGPDVVIEAAGAEATFRLAAEIVAFSGRVVHVGYVGGPATVDATGYVRKELDVCGARNATRADFDDAIHLLASGLFPEEEIVTEVPFNEAGDALEAWDRDPGRFVKLHVRFS